MSLCCPKAIGIKDEITIYEHCDRVAQFLKELIDTRDFYVRDATCLLSRVEICDIINSWPLSNNKIVYVQLFC